MTKHFAVLGILVGALILAGGVYYFTQIHDVKDSVQELAPAAGGQEAGGAAQATSVAVLTLEKQKVPLTYTLPGRITAFRQAQIRPQVDGIITGQFFEGGEDVEKGQQLYQIDDARYSAALNSAQADLKSAEASVKAVEARARRYDDLVKIDAVSQQEYDDVKAQLDQARANIAVAQAALDLAQVDLDYTKVYAPISGRIGRSLVTEGTLVTASQSQELAVITQLDPVYIDMQQSGAEAVKLRSRMKGNTEIPVTLRVSETGSEPYPHQGTLKFSEVTVDETAGSVVLRAVMPNPDAVLLPGLFVRAQLDLGRQDVLLVPQQATTRMPDGTLAVWLADENDKARRRTIVANQAFENYWIVDSGLSQGARVIVQGYQKIGPGADVRPAPWSPEKQD